MAHFLLSTQNALHLPLLPEFAIAYLPYHFYLWIVSLLFTII